jgi:hypothetical protein
MPGVVNMPRMCIMPAMFITGCVSTVPLMSRLSICLCCTSGHALGHETAAVVMRALWHTRHGRRGSGRLRLRGVGVLVRAWLWFVGCMMLMIVWMRVAGLWVGHKILLCFPLRLSSILTVNQAFVCDF